jgi:hypothetical protein
MSPQITVTPPSGPTYQTSSGVFQESVGLYVDGSNPVLLGWKTGWISMAGIQGFKKAYWLFILGEYYTPHKFIIGVAYDFNPTIVQQKIITPTNSSLIWGNDTDWGDSSLYGGTPTVEQWQVGFKQPTCQSFQITFSEMYDASLGVPAGPGLTITAMELVVGIKKSYPNNIPATNKTG